MSEAIGPACLSRVVRRRAMYPAIITMLVLVALVVFWAATVKIRVLGAAKRRAGLTEEQFSTLASYREMHTTFGRP